MVRFPVSAGILEHNRQYIPGGVASVNRAIAPELVFVRAEGARLYDAEGHEYLDYHAAFAPFVLGHNDAAVNDAVARVLRDGSSLYGSGTTKPEGELAERICQRIPWVERVSFLNSGSEATYLAQRLARAVTGRDHLIVMQGGYNGWHNDVACNLMTPLATLGPRVSPGEYPFHAISAGIPLAHQALVHPVNFNDLDSVEWVCRRYPVAGLITEPCLQNIGVVKPAPGYLQGLRELADRFGFVLIFDEVKTGFRHAIGGHAEVAGVRPDLAVYGKALANGYPIAALGGKRELMERFVDPDPARRVLLAGTYNAHPVPVAAAIATLDRLTPELFAQLEAMGARMQSRLEGVRVARQGSCFCPYFMDHDPRDWHDLAAHHDFALDTRLRLWLIERGVYTFPMGAKQWSISAAHDPQDIDRTADLILEGLRACS